MFVEIARGSSWPRRLTLECGLACAECAANNGATVRGGKTAPAGDASRLSPLEPSPLLWRDPLVAIATREPLGPTATSSSPNHPDRSPQTTLSCDCEKHLAGRTASVIQPLVAALATRRRSSPPCRAKMSTQFTVGVADDTRISSKVLKPPGGGSSDIFGTSSTDEAPARSNKKYASNITLGGGDFAEETRKPSSIDSNDGSSTTSSTTSNGTPDNSEPNTPRSGTPLLSGPIAYHDTQEAVPTPASRARRLQGNPVTGEGYEGEPAKKEETPRRQRVPPGGFSSKLW